MIKRVSILWSIGLLVLGMSRIAFGQSHGDGKNGTGQNNGNAYGYGHDKVKDKVKDTGRQTFPAPEIDPSGAAHAIAILTGAFLVIRGRRRRDCAREV